MPDYDVGVIALTTPAASAPLAQTRPVVSVRNNGLHDAVASGYIRIYSAGLKVYESEAYSDTIGPGETRPASAVDYWTPETEGTYIVQGYFTTPLDQVEPNNNLWPTTIVISGVVPPPPTPVTPHASQHEEGGADEMSIEALPGRAADKQEPVTHASNHQTAGIDPIDVTNLNGILAEGQIPQFHAASHKIGGADLVSVHALPGATDLELIAHKGAASGYAGLAADGLVPPAQLGVGAVATSNFLNSHGEYTKPQTQLDWWHEEAKSLNDGSERTIFQLSRTRLPDGSIYRIDLSALAYTSTNPNTLTVKVYAGNDEDNLFPVATIIAPITTPCTDKYLVTNLVSQMLAASIGFSGFEADDLGAASRVAFVKPTFISNSGENTVIRVTAQLTSAIAGTDCWVCMAAIKHETFF